MNIKKVNSALNHAIVVAAVLLALVGCSATPDQVAAGNAAAVQAVGCAAIVAAQVQAAQGQPDAAKGVEAAMTATTAAPCQGAVLSAESALTK